MNYMTKNNLFKPLKLILFSFLLTLATISITGLLMPSHEWFSASADHQSYLAMAKSPFNYYIAPFCWRIGVPLVAGMFNNAQMGFLAITVTSFILSGVGLYLLAESYGFSGVLPAVGVLLFFFSDGVRFALFDFYLPDALMFSILIFSILSILKRNDIFFMVLLLLGVFVKETILLVLPLRYSLVVSKPVEPRALFRTFLLGLPAILVLFAIRFLIPNENPGYNYGTLLTWMPQHHINNFSLNEYVFRSFGIAAILPFLAIKKNRVLFLRFSPFLILVFSQLLFAGNTYRLIAVGIPAMIIMSLNTLNQPNPNLPETKK